MRAFALIFRKQATSYPLHMFGKKASDVIDLHYTCPENVGVGVEAIFTQDGLLSQPQNDRTCIHIANAEMDGINVLPHIHHLFVSLIQNNSMH